MVTLAFNRRQVLVIQHGGKVSIVSLVVYAGLRSMGNIISDCIAGQPRQADDRLDGVTLLIEFSQLPASAPEEV